MDAGGNEKVDPALASFIQEESQRQKFTATVHALNDVSCNHNSISVRLQLCWDVCLSDRSPPSKLDAKTSTCLNNCVNRFIDASQFMLQRLAQMQQTGGKLG